MGREKRTPSLQHVLASHPKGQLGRGDWLLWIKALSALGQARGRRATVVTMSK